MLERDGPALMDAALQAVQQEQAQRNRASRDAWQRYAVHRANVSSLLLALAKPGARLLLIGAGNCNDVDLNQLGEKFAQIHLADLDGEALRWGLHQQGLAADTQFVVHAGVELTGIAPFFARWRAADPGAEEVAQAALLANQHCWDFLRVPICQGPFDVVASVGVLSQLIEAALPALRVESPSSMTLLQALRSRHLSLMLQALRPGGCAMVVTEVLSSDSCAALRTVTPAALPDLLRDAVNAQNFYTGLNPAVLHALLQQDPELGPLTTQVRVGRPWIWDFGARIYACCALAAVRSGLSP